MKRRAKKQAPKSPKPAIASSDVVTASDVADSGSPPRIRDFFVTLRVRVAIDQRLFDDVLTEEWRESFYSLLSEEAVASHLAYNLVKDRRLSSLDGFADQPEDRARVEEVFFEEGDAEEVAPPPQARGRREGARGKRVERWR